MQMLQLTVAILCSKLAEACPASGLHGATPAVFVERLAFLQTAMSVIVNYLKSRMEILFLNEKTGMDTTSQLYENLCKEAVIAVKQVCMGVRGVSPQELADLLDAVAKAPLKAEHRDELRDLFNQKLNNDPSLSLAKSDTTKVDFPENYMRQEDWDKLLDCSVDVTSKLLYLATLWASLGLMHPTERSAKNIAALGVLTEAELVILGPLGVQHLRTFKKFLKDCVAKIKASHMLSNPPGVYTGYVGELQRSFPEWYSNVYKEASPPVGCPPHLLGIVKKMQASMGCMSSKAGGSTLGSLRGTGSMGAALQALLNMQKASQVQSEQPLPGLVMFPGKSMGQGLPGSLPLPGLQPPQGMDQGLPGPLAPPLDPTAAPAQPTGILALPAPPGPAAGSKELSGKGSGLGQHVDAMQAILAKRKHATIDGEDGASAMDAHATTPSAKVQPPLAKTPPKEQPPGKTAPKKLTRKASLKRPAAAPMASSSVSLDFPGTSSRAPLVYGNSKVYFCKTQFRLMEQMGDRVDVSYSFKVKDPKEVWKVLAKRLRELNP